jgi:hypothetical protein
MRSPRLLRATLLPLALAAAATSAGCASQQVPCPRVLKVQDAERLTRFTGAGRDLTDVLFEAQVGEITGSCGLDEGAIDMTMNVTFQAMRGPADRARRADFAYFVAIVDADGDVLAREGFDSNLEFPEARSRAGVVEELQQRIPAGSGTPPYTVYVGFALTPDELAFNRGGR